VDIPIERMEQVKMEQLLILALMRAERGLTHHQEAFHDEAARWLRDNTDGYRVHNPLALMRLIPLETPEPP
jgi:hypothetical protein